MIKLLVEDYCQNCPKFEPECKTLEYSVDRVNFVYDHIIRCGNRSACGLIQKYLESRKEKKDDQN